MRLASMTKRGDRLSRTRRKLRAVRLASVVGIERSYSAKRASIMVRMLLGEWLCSYCVALLEKLKHILDEVKLDNDFPHQAIRFKLARGKSQLEIWIGFFEWGFGTSGGEVCYILLRTELFGQRSQMSWHESCSIHWENIPCRFLIDLYMELSFDLLRKSVSLAPSNRILTALFLCSSTILVCSKLSSISLLLLIASCNDLTRIVTCSSDSPGKGAFDHRA